jgi:hypothetical protein
VYSKDSIKLSFKSNKSYCINNHILLNGQSQDGSRPPNESGLMCQQTCRHKLKTGLKSGLRPQGNNKLRSMLTTTHDSIMLGTRAVKQTDPEQAATSHGHAHGFPTWWCIAIVSKLDTYVVEMNSLLVHYIWSYGTYGRGHKKQMYISNANVPLPTHSMV